MYIYVARKINRLKYVIKDKAETESPPPPSLLLELNNKICYTVA